MNEGKPWYKSKGIIGAIGAMLSMAVVMASQVFDLDAEAVASITGFVLAAVALWGRLAASTKIMLLAMCLTPFTIQCGAHYTCAKMPMQLKVAADGSAKLVVGCDSDPEAAVFKVTKFQPLSIQGLKCAPVGE